MRGEERERERTLWCYAVERGRSLSSFQQALLQHGYCEAPKVVGLEPYVVE